MVISDNCKLVTIYGTGAIPALYGISCPVTIPVELPIDTIITMINKGFKIYEVNPKKKSEKIRLTTINARKINFPNTNFSADKVNKKTEKVEENKEVESDEINNRTDDKKEDQVKRIIKSDFD